MDDSLAMFIGKKYFCLAPQLYAKKMTFEHRILSHLLKPTTTIIIHPHIHYISNQPSNMFKSIILPAVHSW